jgi:flagellar basal-body rod protein FlgB
MTTGIPMMAMLENYLKLASSREQSISANMANIDTPGYRTRDINFESEFNKVMSAGLHQSEDGAEAVQMSPVVHEVQGLMERPDGNNVNLEHEGLMLARTQLQYQLAIQLIQNHFHQQLSAINGAGG